VVSAPRQSAALLPVTPALLPARAG
jgi:hypothetical protein